MLSGRQEQRKALIEAISQTISNADEDTIVGYLSSVSELASVPTEITAETEEVLTASLAQWPGEDPHVTATLPVE